MFTFVKITLFSFVNMKNNELENFLSEPLYRAIKFSEVTGRYLKNEELDICLDSLSDKFEIEILGKSVLNKPVKLVKFGDGDSKVLAWSQMHGNEGTTTKAVFDLLNTFNLKANDPIVSAIVEQCTFYVIPILNPDGAEAYTRVNANNIDLNRDMQNLSQPESRILMDLYKRVQPDYCLNLHDQRTIFSVGESAMPATLSFLTPAKDEERSLDESRKISMSLIAGMVNDLSSELENRIGRYDDAFNINCAGDTFQHLSTPTILFEAGHYPGDYEREVTRKFLFKALYSCIYQIAMKSFSPSDYEEYFRIPENRKLFNDVIIRNAKVGDELLDISFQFKEVLNEGKINFMPEVQKLEQKITNFGHKEFDANGQEVQLPGNASLDENVIVNKIIINSTELEVKTL